MEVLDILDDHARLAVACDAYPAAPRATCYQFRQGFRSQVVPTSVLTDCGAISTAVPDARRLRDFAAEVTYLRIDRGA